MRAISGIRAMKAVAARARAAGRSIGFVPTMGYLHEGHLSLVRAARKRTDTVVVSVFVNPLQFGPLEDLKRYPRDIRRDTALLRKEGVDVLFRPPVRAVYPEGFRTQVEVEGLQDVLCGQSRPGHFRGVCTVALKLFNIVKPDLAFFGRKDYQQALIIRRMARDLDLDVRVVTLPIVREPDGLAMSSRNAYLSPAERRAALVLTKSLNAAKMMVEGGETRAGALVQRVRAIIEKEPAAKIDYVAVVDPEELTPLEMIKDRALLALSAYVGGTRLIDNVLVRPKK